MNNFAKRLARLRGETVMQTLPVRLRAAEKGGEAVGEATLKERVEWAGELVAEVANQALALLWSKPGFTALSTHKELVGYRAVEKSVGVQKLAGKHLDSRVVWMGEEVAARIARQQIEEAKCIQGLLNDTPPPFTSAVWLRNLRRSLNKFEYEWGHAPKDYFEYKPDAPHAPNHLLPLACADKQLAKWVEGGKLSVKLPTTPSPESSADWAWHVLPLELPAYAQTVLRKGGTLLIPSLRVSKRGHVLLDLVVESKAPATVTEDKTRTATAVDWGERRHLTLTDGWLGNDNQIRLSGRPQFFNARGLQAKQATRRRRAGELKAQRDQIDKLLQGRPSQPQLITKRAIVEAERVAVWGAYNRCSNQWAHTAARWIVEHTKAIGADTIILEDLRSLESRKDSRGLNGRINHQLRSAVYKLVEHKAAMEGLRVQYVSPRNTSAQCPLCQGENRHHRSSENKAEGRGWSTCERCGYTRDRDIMGAQHVLVKGLRLHQTVEEQKTKPRRVTRPALTPAKKHRKPVTNLPKTLHVAHAKRVQQGYAVRPQLRPRPLPTLSGWGQRRFRSSCIVHRDIHGLSKAYTGRIRLTAARPVPALQE